MLKILIFFTAIIVSVIANAASNNASEIDTQTDTEQNGIIETGRLRFASDCGFCHGRDAAGGTQGPDLVRSELVALNNGADLIAEVVRIGRADAGMPAFTTISSANLESIVAFIYDQKLNFETAQGGRRAVEPSDLDTGNAEQGQRYFVEACSGCHSANEDLKGIASRLEGLPLLRRMLYPGSESRIAADAIAKPELSVITKDGQTVSGPLVYQDEFTIAMIDEVGSYRSWGTGSVTFSINNPLDAHVEQLSIYTDEDMHNVLAYLQTLR